MATQTYKSWSVVTASTTAFTVCFMVWMMFGVIGIPIKKTLGLNATEFGLLTAMPVLSVVAYRYASEGFLQHANAITTVITLISITATVLAERLQGASQPWMKD